MRAAGTIAAAVYNVNRGKDSPVFTAEDFVPNFKLPEQEDLEPEEADIDSLRSFFGTGTQASRSRLVPDR